MMRRSPAVLVSLLAATLIAGGCDNGPEPTTPTPNPEVTETFTGVVNLNGAVTHPFTAQGAGSVVATITTIDPTGSLIGFELGTWSGSACTAVQSNPAATQSGFLSGTTQTAANLCVRMHDPNGTLTAGPVSYTVTVVHR
jgi:hypothetical protein